MSFSSGETAFVNPDRRFSTASVFKVFVLVDLYRRFLEGKLDPDYRLALKDTDRSIGSGVLQYIGEGADLRLRDYARLMMIISDNTAADVLFDYLGRKSIADTVSWLGLRNTQVGWNCKDMLTSSIPQKEALRILDFLGIPSDVVERQQLASSIRSKVHKLSGVHTLKEIELLKAIDEEHGRPLAMKDQTSEDYTTPRDLVETFYLIFRERVLGRFTDEAMEIMAACETGRNRIRKGIPRKQTLVHKTGTMKGIVNDAGIILSNTNSYALVVLVNNIPIGSAVGYVSKGEKIIADLSATVWKAQSRRRAR